MIRLGEREQREPCPAEPSWRLVGAGAILHDGRSVGRVGRLLQLIPMRGALSVWHLYAGFDPFRCTASFALAKRIPGRLLAVARLYSLNRGNRTPCASRSEPPSNGYSTGSRTVCWMISVSPHLPVVFSHDLLLNVYQTFAHQKSIQYASLDAE